MATAEQKRAPLWLLPQETEPLPEVRKRWPRLAIGINLVLIAAAVPMFLYVLPATRWQPQALATLLICAGMLGMMKSHDLRPNVSVDSAVGIAFIAMMLLGPLVGFAVLVASEGVWALQRYTRSNAWITPSTNLALHCWTCITFSLVLLAGGFQPADSLNAITVLLLAVGAGLAACMSGNLILGISSKTWDGVSFRHAILLDGGQEIVDLAIVPCSVLVAFTYQQIGLVALLSLVGLILLPRLLAWRIVRAQSINHLSPREATRAYSLTLADFLKLNTERKTALASAARQLDGGSPVFERLDDFQQVMQAMLYAHERWDGGEGGFPGVLSGEQIPIESRVLAVAHEWSSLTARGTRELEPELALAELRARAGSEFDPRVVAAAAQAVEQGLVPVDPRKPIRLRPEPALRAN